MVTCEKATISIFFFKYTYSSFLALVRATCAHWLRPELYFFGERKGSEEREMLLKLNNETFPGSGEEWVVQKTIKEADEPERWKDQNADMAKDNGVSP